MVISYWYTTILPGVSVNNCVYSWNNCTQTASLISCAHLIDQMWSAPLRKCHSVYSRSKLSLSCAGTAENSDFGALTTTRHWLPRCTCRCPITWRAARPSCTRAGAAKDAIWRWVTLQLNIALADAHYMRTWSPIVTSDLRAETNALSCSSVRFIMALNPVQIWR